MKKRFMFDDLVSYLDNRRFIIITGARQTGKSTLLVQLMEHCKTEGRHVAFLNLEHKDIKASLDSSPENIFQYIPDTQDRIYIFIDEIQKLADPSNFLKVLWDDYKESIKIVATGSSAFYMDEKFDDSLAGRKKIFQLYTCSFEEYLYLGDEDILLNEYRRIRQGENSRSTMLPLLQNSFFNYMRFGGYPEVIITRNEREKMEILKDLRDSFVKKDLEDAGIKDDMSFFRLMQMLALQAGNLVNVSELAKIVRIKEETVGKYMQVMEKSFHIKLVKPFYKNHSKELVKMPMVYFLDSGMRNALADNFLPIVVNPAAGQIWENQIFRILAGIYGVDELRFWRTIDKKEVDFVIPSAIPPLAIEVKSDSSKATVSKYKTFTSLYPDFDFEFFCLEPFNEKLIRKLV